MTALSMTLTPDRRFIVAADGRCKSDDPHSEKERELETEKAQKIFIVETSDIKFVYAMTGFAMTGEGFDLVAECRKQAELLPTARRFFSGYDCVEWFAKGIKNVVDKALRNRTITKFADTSHLEPSERARKFKFYFAGYFKESLFFLEVRFYHRIELGSMQFEMALLDTSRPNNTCVGSDSIANQIYGDAVPDPRIAKYRTSNVNSLEFTTSFIQACADPVAQEIDPNCNAIGGHIHAVEVTRHGVKWLIPLAS